MATHMVRGKGEEISSFDRMCGVLQNGRENEEKMKEDEKRDEKKKRKRKKSKKEGSKTCWRRMEDAVAGCSSF